MKQLIIGLPKGSLQETTFKIFNKAGFVINNAERSYSPDINDSEISVRLIRAQEISRYVEHGMLDAGITGYDWITENNSDVIDIADLLYAKRGLKAVKWVVAVPEQSAIKKPKDLAGKRIATEAVGIAKNYLRENHIQAEVEFSWGATEIKTPELVDAIIELTETGSSLRANHLRIIDTVLESVPKLIGNKKSWEDSWKKKKIQQLALLLKGALDAEDKVLLKMNVQREHVDDVLKVIPALHSPTINNLTDRRWAAIETVINEQTLRDTIPKLKSAGAADIIEIPLNKIIK
jgi:ATP phosphoribosyltransferase